MEIKYNIGDVVRVYKPQCPCIRRPKQVVVATITRITKSSKVWYYLDAGFVVSENDIVEKVNV